MTRIARALASGLPHHAVQRGNNKDKVFLDDDDFEKYRHLLVKYSVRWECPILSYCLMSNHVHLLLRPLTDCALPKMMQGTALCYTQYFNKKYSRSGRLWESRYYSCIVDSERYLWAVARYIEQNPVRAGLVKCESEYHLSSARAHLGVVRDAVLGEDLFAGSERDDYVASLGTTPSPDDLGRLRQSLRTGIPLGTEGFVGEMEKRLNRSISPGRRGRPCWRQS